MAKCKIILLIVVVFLFKTSWAQEHEEAKHRVALVLGHSYVSLDNNEILSIPTFGLDYEYWLNNHWGIGVFSDIELITNELTPTVDDVRVEREYPIVLTFDVVWNPIEHIEFVVGPGFVFEERKTENIIRLGIEYDLTLGHHWDVAPNVFYDQKLNDGYAVSIGIGIGKSF
ncbi:hypothetical protein ACXGQW_07065 [Wenyingzhuangia sp. IMCC45533]